MILSPRSKIAWLFRVARVGLILCLGATLASIAILLAYGSEWLMTGRTTHVTLGQLLGSDVAWLRVPLCVVAPAVAIAALYLAFNSWNDAIQRDIQLTPPES